MNPTIKAKLEHLVFQITSLCNDFRLDESSDAAFCARLLSQCIGNLEMRIEENWGYHLKPVEMLPVTTPEPVAIQVTEEVSAVPEPVVTTAKRSRK